MKIPIGPYSNHPVKKEGYTNEGLSLPSDNPGSSSKNNKSNLPKFVSRIGLGCSSFSTFFLDDSASKETKDALTVSTIDRSNPIVQEWITTIKYAIVQAGITLLDTAPWYGHGTSEIVIGWAMEELLLGTSSTTKTTTTTNEDTSNMIQRDDIIINTKVGRYEADVRYQFDYRYTTIIESTKRSIERMKCRYIDVLQLHDPEFAPSLDILLKETIPAMLECQKLGYCKALGITGYPLSVQYQIIYESNRLFGRNIWDHALTYSHFNLHDTSLVTDRFISYNNEQVSYLENCINQNIVVLAAAPLSMGLLTDAGPPKWHPASPELQTACRTAATICRSKYNLSISDLALLYAISHPQIPCTILGIKNIEQVQTIQKLANRIGPITDFSGNHNDVLKAILSDNEWNCLQVILDPTNGPFAKLQDLYRWDGIEQARIFWKSHPLLPVVDNNNEQDTTMSQKVLTDGTVIVEWQK